VHLDWCGGVNGAFRSAVARDLRALAAARRRTGVRAADSRDRAIDHFYHPALDRCAKAHPASTALAPTRMLPRLGTQTGLYRFDGVKFGVYRPREGGYFLASQRGLALNGAPSGGCGAGLSLRRGHFRRRTTAPTHYAARRGSHGHRLPIVAHRRPLSGRDLHCRAPAGWASAVRGGRSDDCRAIARVTCRSIAKGACGSYRSGSAWLPMAARTSPWLQCGRPRQPDLPNCRTALSGSPKADVFVRHAFACEVPPEDRALSIFPPPACFRSRWRLVIPAGDGILRVPRVLRSVRVTNRGERATAAHASPTRRT